MPDAERSSAPTTIDRAEWLRDLRRVNERQEDALVDTYDGEDYAYHHVIARMETR
jgi:hypothetical protein